MRTEKLPLISQDGWERCYQRRSKEQCLIETDLGENGSGDHDYRELQEIVLSGTEKWSYSLGM